MMSGEPGGSLRVYLARLASLVERTRVQCADRLAERPHVDEVLKNSRGLFLDAVEHLSTDKKEVVDD